MKKAITITASIVSVILAVVLGFLYALEYGILAIAVCAAMVVALPFSSLLHELGHITVGAMCKIKAVPSFRLFGSSSCKLIPKTDKHLRGRLIMTACSGLIINAVLFALGVIAFACDAVPFWLSLFLPANAYLFLMNFMPVQLADGKTDGLICNELVNKTDEAKVLLAVLTVQAQVLNGTPIEEVDEKLLFDLPQIQEDDQAFISLTELRYEYFKAKGDEENAAKWQARFEELKKEYL